MKLMKRLVMFCMLLMCLSGCKQDFVPKPRGYYNIEFPEKKYRLLDDVACPYTFMVPNYATIDRDTSFFHERPEHPCWLNVKFKDYNATIFMSYKDIQGRNTLEKLVGDAFRLTFKHSIKADFIDETYFENKQNNVFGFIYDVGGNAASAVQFFATDSTQHFVRGSLYFNCEPNADSLQPCVDFFRKDVQELVNTIQWR